MKGQDLHLDDMDEIVKGLALMIAFLSHQQGEKGEQGEPGIAGGRGPKVIA